MYRRMIKTVSLSFVFSLLILSTAYASDMTCNAAPPTTQKVLDQSALRHDLEEMKAETPAILLYAKPYITQWGAASQFSELDIDWNNLTKMYLPSSALFTEQPDIDRFLQNAVYFWTLPINVESNTIEIIFNRHDTISDNARHLLNAEELANLEASLGKWRVVGSRAFDYSMNYNRDIKAVLTANGLTEGYEYFTLSALYGIHLPITVILKDNVPLYAFPADSRLREYFNEESVLPVIGSPESGIYYYSDVIALSKSYQEQGLDH